jgi:hypothetical protein
MRKINFIEIRLGQHDSEMRHMKVSMQPDLTDLKKKEIEKKELERKI